MKKNYATNSHINIIFEVMIIEEGINAANHLFGEIKVSLLFLLILQVF